MVMNIDDDGAHAGGGVSFRTPCVRPKTPTPPKPVARPGVVHVRGVGEMTPAEVVAEGMRRLKTCPRKPLL
jgi:hypothetical protein